MTLTVALAGSRRWLEEERREMAWIAFLDAMHALRARLPEPPPYRFLIADLSSVDRYLAERLAAAGREILPVTPPGADNSIPAVVQQLRLELGSGAHALVGVWDARVHEPLDLLRAAAEHRRPYEVRILHDPAAPDPDRPWPWHVVSSAHLLPVDRTPQPTRSPTIGERFGTAYDIDL